MTRESKLALIIGFVLVLVVGVLVSDHFSQASTMTLDTRETQTDTPQGPITMLGQGSSNNDRETALKRQSQPIEIRNGRGANEPTRQTTRQAAGQNTNSILDRALNQVQETDFPKAAQISQRTAPAQSTPPQTRPLPNKTFKSYTVVSGDSLIRIARRQLNDGERWKEIHQLNADVLGPDAILKIGMTLKLPSDAIAKQAVSTSAVREYVVESGDTLGQISMKLLGTSKRDGEIAKLNGLESKNDIRIGMKLKIPAR